MDEDPPISITAQRSGDPVQPARMDHLTAKHYGRYLVRLVDLINPLIHEPTIAAASDERTALVDGYRSGSRL
ncbi:hypothetical protein ACFW08_24685 [Streptomyces sp. NPDC058960]|uniref:hypothetical protein n=1 Tax=Streptomyces sp. NPDC058960 TaxID=3346679 RepID=UPI0036B5C1EF